MSDPLIPFAKLLSNDELVSIDEVPAGKDCGCVCMFCDIPLVARKGDVKMHHFAHSSKNVDEEKPCLSSFERAVFWMARTVFQEQNSIHLPKLELTFHNHQYRVFKEYQAQSKTVDYEEMEIVDPLVDHKFDTLILKIKGVPLAVSIYYSNKSKLPFGGAYKWKDHHIASLSINLAGLYSVFTHKRTGFKEILTQYLISNTENKTWLFHPRENIFRRKFEEELQIEITKAQKIRISKSSSPPSSKEEALKRFNKRMRDASHGRD